MDGFVQIKLFATLAAKVSADTARYPIEEGTRIEDVLAKLEIPKELAKLVFVNGRKAPLTTLLKDGDRVGIFPPVGGG